MKTRKIEFLRPVNQIFTKVICRIID